LLHGGSRFGCVPGRGRCGAVIPGARLPPLPEPSFADPVLRGSQGSPPHAAACAARTLRDGVIWFGFLSLCGRQTRTVVMTPGTGIGLRSALKFNRGDGPAMERLRPLDTGFSAHRGTVYFQTRIQDWSPMRSFRAGVCCRVAPGCVGCPTPSHKPASPSRSARHLSRGIS
jgi:hypothetical protein